jgi:hypothetical protein
VAKENECMHVFSSFQIVVELNEQASDNDWVGGFVDTL